MRLSPLLVSAKKVLTILQLKTNHTNIKTNTRNKTWGVLVPRMGNDDAILRDDPAKIVLPNHPDSDVGIPGTLEHMGAINNQQLSHMIKVVRFS